MMLSGYLVVGALAGILSGLLGIGGGIIVVPALSAMFLHNTDIPEAFVMQMALGTSLAIMVVTLLSSMIAHHRRGAVNWNKVKMTLPGLMIGAMIGAIIVPFLSSRVLSIFFGIFLIVIAVKLLFEKQNIESKNRLLSTRVRQGLTGVIGILSSLLGAGGGTMLVPFFLYSRMSMHEATGTSVACGLGIALVGAFSFMLTGMVWMNPISGSIGYVYGPAFLGVAIMSVLFAPLGAHMAHQIPASLLKRIFAIFLLIMSMDMILSLR